MTSYQKHHSPASQIIPEDYEAEQEVRVIRPMNGIESNKYQPIIRNDPSIKITVTPLTLSPTNYSLKRQPISNIEDNIGTAETSTNAGFKN